MITGQCLCGANRFELDGALSLNHHCHCGYCRKHHGTGYASLVGIPAEQLTWTRGELIRYESSPGLVRESCATCGTPMPQQIEGLPIFVPAGCLEALDTNFEFHIFVASKADWDEIDDALPAFDAYPPGVDSETQKTKESPDPPDGARGSCLCGDVRWTVEGEGIAARHCHCGRCRKGRGAAHATNWVVPTDAIRFTAGEDAVRRYKVPEAEFFTQTFCGRCGGKTPTVDTERKIAVIPMGALDDAPGQTPAEHIFIADKPAWTHVHDALPQHAKRG